MESPTLDLVRDYMLNYKRKGNLIWMILSRCSILDTLGNTLKSFSTSLLASADVEMIGKY